MKYLQERVKVGGGFGVIFEVKLLIVDILPFVFMHTFLDAAIFVHIEEQLQMGEGLEELRVLSQLLLQKLTLRNLRLVKTLHYLRSRKTKLLRNEERGGVGL